jgi:topoisomerase-4 subunit B
MNAQQLYETTMDPNSRTLIKVSIDDFADTEKQIKILMGDQVEPRRDWIENHVTFTNEDNFEIKE